VRIGFLFNHDQVHQVAHSLPIALEMASRCDAEIILAVSRPNLAAEVVRLAGAQLGTATLVHLRLERRSSVVLSRILEGAIPTNKLLIYRDNLDFFRSLDMLVVTEKTSLILKSLYKLDDLKIVHTRHGAGDRAIGFDAASARFDHVLVSGAKVRDRLISEAGIASERISVVGYPKFDLPLPPRSFHPVLDDGRPIVLYNPHSSPHLSSWYPMGREVLDWFVAHEEYQLIFAPHVMLFERPFVLSVDKLRLSRPGHIAERYLHAPNIHIDLGSRASTTMAYTERADIYLGDVSSQVYEFLRRPRPCLFLDAQGQAGWESDPNFAHWRAGPVIRSTRELAAGLERAMHLHASQYRSEQERIFDYSFDLTTEPSSVRAARVLAGLAGVHFEDGAVGADLQRRTNG
jgi:hypothetical protein